MKTRALLSLTLIFAALSLLALLGRETDIAIIMSGVTLFFCLVSWFALLFMTRKKSAALARQVALGQELEHQKLELEAKTENETQLRLLLDSIRSESTQAQSQLNTQIQELTERQQAKEAELQALRAQKHSGESQQGRELGDTAVLQFLRSLQERGRLLDFAMADINRLPDAQVGAAARVVHQGVKVVLQDYFDIQPISQDQEGSLVSLPREDTADSQKFRILSRDAAEASTSQGRLLHRGWEALHIRLPQSMPRAAASARIIAPAEIDVQTSPN